MTTTIQTILAGMRELREKATQAPLACKYGDSLYFETLTERGWHSDLLPNVTDAKYIAAVACPVTGSAKRCEEALERAVYVLDRIAQGQCDNEQRYARDMMNSIRDKLEGKDTNHPHFYPSSA
jgi:hypothetical protein